MFLWHLLFSIIFIIYKIESGKIRPNFDEIFGDGWNKNEREEKVMIKIEQNEQNDNSAAIDQMGDEMGNSPIDQQKREIIQKFEAIKGKLREKGIYNRKNQSKIETKIGRLLGASTTLIWKWKNELNLNKNKIKKQFYDEKKLKFIERFDEFNKLYRYGKLNEFAKELGISERTFLKWKKELVPKYNKKENKLRKVKEYYEIKESNPKMSDKIIAKKLGIGFTTLNRWKNEFATT